MTVQEVAERLKVSENTVRRWIREGELKALKAGKSYRITEEQLQKFLEKK